MIEVTMAPTSPFVRKVRIVAAMKGLEGKVRLLAAETEQARNDALRAANPLQKVPAARLDDGTLIYDSHVISEYFDAIGDGPRLFPQAGGERWAMLTQAALADGIMEAAVLVVYEGRFRPQDKWHQPWVDKQQQKVDAAIAHLESHVPAWTSHPDYAHVCLACALGFLDLRQGGRWRATSPNLVAWLDRFAAAVPAFEATRPPAG